MTQAGIDTIAAVATAPGEGGVSIVRVSGPAALAIADRVFRCPPPRPSERAPMTFVYGRVVESDESTIDDGLLLIFRAPRSYTGEDAIEIQGHGGAVNARRILRRVLDAGARPAEPGEFTKRAFLQGRLDLVQAEAVADLIHARSDRAAVAASMQLEGRLSREFDRSYDSLVQLAANLEATLDFSEDELPPNILAGILDQIRQAATSMATLASSWEEGHLLRDGAKVVISGRPNVGKSTLLNALTGKDRAIVSSTPGTTRDTVEETLILEGLQLLLVDTAGLRDTDCDIESEGIRRTHRQLEQADVYMIVVDRSAPLHEDELKRIRELPPERTMVILNKGDVGYVPLPSLPVGMRLVEASLVTGAGVDDIRAALRSILERGMPTSAGQRAVISARHRALLEEALRRTRLAAELLESGREDAPTLAADELRSALEALGQVTGKVYHDELLKSIFSRFCIGK